MGDRWYESWAVPMVTGAFMTGWLLGGAPWPSYRWDAINAIGTLAAVGIALYVAHMPIAKQRRDAADLASLTATRFSALAAELAENVQGKVRVLEGAGTSFEDGLWVVRASQDLTAIANRLPVETLRDLLPLPSKCAHRLVFGIAKLEYWARRAQEVIEGDNWREGSYRARLTMIGDWKIELEEAADLISAAAKQLREEVDRRNLAISLEERYG